MFEISKLDTLQGSPAPQAASLENVAVEGHPPAELRDDPLEHGEVLRLRVGVECRHHAPTAELLDRDERVADPESPARPRALRQALDALDEDVRTEPAAIHAERRDRAVGGDEERQHVEPLASIVARESRVGPGRLSHRRGRFLRRPRAAADPRLAVGPEIGEHTSELQSLAYLV